MPDIVELLKKSCGGISCEQCNDEREKAAAEIVRLREGLRALRYGIFKDAAAVNGLIDELICKDLLGIPPERWGTIRF